MQTLRQIHQELELRIQQYALPKEPSGLYEPVSYIMTLGGKRIRPVLCLLGFLNHRNQIGEPIWDACLALELFHNFSLVHDDIMDDAPRRRGQPTVHTRWDVPTAILSGDVMLIEVYHLLQKSCDASNLADVLHTFHRVAVGLCEGQQWDMSFEKEATVSWEAYLRMIYGKTAILLGGSLEIGALLGKQTPEDARALGKVGDSLGLAFQLEDDLLDAFGVADLTGKQTGGDILRNKKTALVIQASLLGSQADRDELLHWFTKEPMDLGVEKIQAVQKLFEQTGARASVEHRAERYYMEAMQELDRLEGQGPGANLLRELAAGLRKRPN